MSKAVMYEDTAWQREHLCLILHSSEGCREYQTVIVALELRPVVMPLGMMVFLAQTLVCYKSIPIHIIRLLWCKYT